MSKTVKLNGFERLKLINIVPKKGTILENKIIRQVSDKIEFSADELKLYDLKTEIKKDEKTGKDKSFITWNKDTILEEKELEFSEPEIDVILKPFKEMDTKGDFPIELLGIYEKFEK